MKGVFTDSPSCLLSLLSVLSCSHSAESELDGLEVCGLWLHFSYRGCYEPLVYTLYSTASEKAMLKVQASSTSTCIASPSDSILTFLCRGKCSKLASQIQHVRFDPETDKLRALPFPICMVYTLTDALCTSLKQLTLELLFCTIALLSKHWEDFSRQLGLLQ